MPKGCTPKVGLVNKGEGRMEQEERPGLCVGPVSCLMYETHVSRLPYVVNARVAGKGA